MTGIICLRKPEGITSFQAVRKTRGITGEKKAGHCGTLDPDATGVLPVMLGGATRFLEFLPTTPKQYRAVMKLGDPSVQMNIETIPTGSLSLDIALGLGGIPKGRIIEIYGPESSGKTTVTLHMIAEVQKRGGIAGFIDAEHALDPVYAKNIGVDIDNLYISQPDSGEQALEIAETMVRSGAIDIVVVDSVAALVPKAEIDGDMGDSHVGLHARLMSQALRKLTAVISKSNCAVVFINQLREKVGVMFGNPETTTGGRALKFYSSVRMDVRRIESLKQSGEVIGKCSARAFPMWETCWIWPPSATSSTRAAPGTITTATRSDRAARIPRPI